MHKVCGWLLIFSLFAACRSLSGADSGIVILKIYHTSDIHSHLLPNPENKGGLAYLSSALKTVRAQDGSRSLILDAGDLYRKGSLPARLSQDQVMADIVTQMPYFDARVLGNNELKVGITRIIDWARHQEPAPLLSANFVDRAGLPVFKPFYIFEKAGLKIAVIGMTYEGAFEDMKPGDYQPDLKKDPRSPYRLLPTQGLIKALVAKLRPQVDILILLSHQTFEEEKRWAKEFPEIDLVVCGHSHLVTGDQKTLGGPLIVEAGEFGQQVGVVTLAFDRLKKKVISEDSTFWPVGPDSQVPDPQIQSAVDEAYKRYAPHAREKIGDAKEEMDLLGPQNRYEGALDDWLADLLQEVSGSDVALVNTEMIREKIYKGPVTFDELTLSLPYTDSVATVKMRRVQLEKMLKVSIGRGLQKGGIIPFGFSKINLELTSYKTTGLVGPEIKILGLPDKGDITVALPNFFVKHCQKFFDKAFCPFEHAVLGRDIGEAVEEKVRRVKMIERPVMNRVRVLQSHE